MIPGIIAVTCAMLWQVYLILYLGPGTAAGNLALVREASAGAAFIFSRTLMLQNVDTLLTSRIYLGALAPTLIYGFWLSFPRRRENQRWNVIYIITVLNLLWYVVASIGWIRYAFLGLALTPILVAKFFDDLTDHFQISTITQFFTTKYQALRAGDLVRTTALVWLAGMLILPVGSLLKDIVHPPFNAAVAMAAYLAQHVPHNALIETWEPEMGFLTDHNYHFPPPETLIKAVDYAWLHGPPTSDFYELSPENLPPYILLGNASRFYGLYSEQFITDKYQPVTSSGNYELLTLR